MANNKTLQLPVLGDFTKFLVYITEIGIAPMSFAWMALATCGVGKSAQVKQFKKTHKNPVFFLPGTAYSRMTAMVPTPHKIAPGRSVTEQLAKEIDEMKLPEWAKIEAYRNRLECATELNMEMTQPRYLRLERWLIEADKQYKKTGLIPLIILDEATMMPRDSRDRFFTDVVDGNLCEELGVVRPVCFLTGNGRYGGSSNEPQEVRQVHRTVQFVYYPDAGEIPSTVPNFNSTTMVRQRETSRTETLAEMMSGDTAVITAREFPRNKIGTPRAQEFFMWLCFRVKALKLPDPVKFLTDCAEGFFLPGHDTQDAVANARQLFSVFPATLEEVRAIVDDPKAVISPGVKALAAKPADWVSWARAISDGSDAESEDLGRFAEKAGCGREVVRAIKQARANA